MNPEPSPPPSVPLLLDDEWEAPPPSKARVVVIAAAIAVAVIVTCVELLRNRERMWEPEAEAVWNPIPSVPAALSPDTEFRAAAVPAEPPIVVVRTGYVSINSSPWAELSIDGRVVGTTPQVKVRVTSGRHLLRFVRDGFQQHSTWITVPPGGTVRLTDITLKEVAR